VAAGTIGQKEQSELGTQQDMILVVVALADIRAARSDGRERASNEDRVVATVDGDRARVHGLPSIREFSDDLPKLGHLLAEDAFDS
jgi:hypothetical protein